MQEMKHGKLKSGRVSQKLTGRKVAIAIGLSEVRKKTPKFLRRNFHSSGSLVVICSLRYRDGIERNQTNGS
jgi:hypothetical protein